ncbi:AP2/ERF family transcription factor [Bacillus thuringiensis]|uniref:AP2/ERF domain-containing protein n=1 Tax=Bacillus thuringiensis TaxID=1428 RepID=A0A9X6Z1Y5_BACTU|nr:AP2/ERF family transcription factor [Bacillus thuringiensis]KIP28272.1 AP2 domain protein [Bacillus thuringiensis serovar morrisoni]MCT6945014.1 AP2/ERF family transcription factor [Bacillus thuringiensis]MED2074028.1 AP2/ERF family transcription factor [Bacillus thuringiensis]NUW53272.1 AP2/ERF family transcription factor [Bacillus thuringiensis]PFA88782.1 hypothetical protein CN398_30515 [Bacillus thuringiensis]
MVKEISLQNDMLAIVDDEDYERVSQYNWSYFIHSGTQIRIQRYFDNKKKLSETLQSFILNQNSKEMIITFLDGNQLNFQKDNLKITDAKYISQKRKGNRNSTSKYKGVSWDKIRKKWMSSIKNNEQTMYLGRYDSENDAALAYNKAAIEIFGEHAYQNKIGEDNSAEEINVGKCLKPRRKSSVSSNYRGVRKINNSWISQISKNRKLYHLGSFKNELEAARTYDKKAIELYGDKAILNFPEEVS